MLQIDQPLRPSATTLEQSLLLTIADELSEDAAGSVWPDVFINKKNGQVYEPHNDEEYKFVYEDSPRYLLLKGGEGAGKSSAGIIKALNRIRRGMNGILVSPDFEHFKKSLWPEFANWCPWQCVIERHRYRSQAGWEPSRAFTLVFKNDVGGHSQIICGGVEETAVAAWEGANVNFLHFDESRRHKTPAAIKMFDGRIRIPGPNGEPPQMFLTTTPRKHWLFDLFGPIKEDDPYEDFKKDSFVGTVLTEENEANLEPGFVEKREQSLTKAEARILLKAEWEDESDVEKFVNIIWWDNCKESLPPLTRSEPMVIALDAAEGSQQEGPTLADCFAMVGLTRHPQRKDDVAVRYCGIWRPQPGQLLDYKPIEEELIRLCREYSVIEVAYDPTQLHYMCTQLQKQGIAHFRRFSQQNERLAADKQLQQMIVSRRIAHDGNPLLRQHIDNANIKKYGQDGIRIVKRTQSLKVDSAVAISMGTARSLFYNLA